MEEAKGYRRVFRRIQGCDLIYRRGPAKSDNLILVRHSIDHSPGFVHKVTTHGFWLGHGWTHKKYVTTVVVAG